MIGNHFKKKFSKRPPPGIIVTTTQERIFENVVSTYGTAAPIQTQSFKIEKYEILKPINFNQKVNKGDVIPVPDGAFHRVFNESDELLEFAAVFNGERHTEDKVK